ncbi:phage tail protein [Lactococcus lactis]|uniref:phage tail protein n=1 Tax=Lactococcus lactis TaxID=1358 RepID=UPI0020B6E30E|nr:phage tail protein [Lactococcus lactis]
MQLNIHDSTLKRIGFINNDLPDALHYFNDNWHRYLAEGTSTFDFSVNKVNPDYALLTLQNYISFTYDGEDYLFNIINIEQDHYSMQLQCENLNLELISEEVGAYGNTKRHSIVWYLKNAAKITDNVVEIGNNPFSTIDEDTSNPILSFDSTETKLARIISICNSFKAEFQFKTNLKDDGTLQNITLDLYQTGGVGQLRKDVTLYYGKNIDGITSTGDRTSTFFNSTTVTDSNNKYNWLSIEGKYYNSDGQLEFYKDAGSNTAYAPLSRDMFPSQILSTSSDQYTNKNIQTSASSNDDLWDYAVSQFKLYAYPQMTYEVIVSVNAVTSALGNDKKLNIGDTIIVQDSTFDKSDGGLILSARVSEQEISFTNPLNNKITFTNFVKLKSAISADLLNKMQELAKQNAPYRSEMDTSNGVQFVNGVGSTTLTARIYLGADPNEKIADSYQWSKDGTLVANAQEITVDASGISEKAVYTYQALINGNVVASQSVTITNVNDGAPGTPGKPGPDGKTPYFHTAWSYSVDGTNRFTTVYPNLNLLKGTKTPISITGNNTANQQSLLYSFDNNNTLTNQGFSINDTLTLEFDWIATNPASGYFILQWQGAPWVFDLPTINLSSTNGSGHVIYTFNVRDKEVDSTAVATGMGYRLDYVPNNTVITFSNVIIRKAKSSQPYMPSSSEVTTADWPSYIGQYTDFTQSGSTNPSDYTWSRIRGNDGKDGQDGKSGDPGKIISDTEPTTKFKGLTWKYSGFTAIDASDGTNIQPNTEYYWNGNNWIINLINAHNINVDDLSAISTTLTNGKFISNWSSSNATGTTTIEKNHLIINSANASQNTNNTIALDNEQGMMMTYNNKTNNRTISAGVNFQGLFVTDSTGPYVSVTPTGIVNSVDVSWTTIGSYAAYRRDGRVVTIRVVGAKRSTVGDIYIGSIPLKDCPAASVMGDAIAWSASVANDKHIQINGLNQQNSGTVTILSAAANQEYTFQFTYQI